MTDAEREVVRELVAALEGIAMHSMPNCIDFRHPEPCDCAGVALRAALARAEALLAESCVCTEGDPCDYHAATCITCTPRCTGHPAEPVASAVGAVVKLPTMPGPQPARCGPQPVASATEPYVVPGPRTTHAATLGVTRPQQKLVMPSATDPVPSTVPCDRCGSDKDVDQYRDWYGANNALCVPCQRNLGVGPRGTRLACVERERDAALARAEALLAEEDERERCAEGLRAALRSARNPPAEPVAGRCTRCDGRGWVYGYNEGIPCSQDPCPECGPGEGEG